MIKRRTPRILRVLSTALAFVLAAQVAQADVEIIAEIDLTKPVGQSNRGVQISEDGLVLTVTGGTAEAVYEVPASVWKEDEALMVVEMDLPPYEPGNRWYNRAKFILTYQGPQGNPRNRQVMTLEGDEHHGQTTMVASAPQGRVSGAELRVRFEQSSGVWNVNRIYFVKGGILVDDSFPWELSDQAESTPAIVSVKHDEEQPLNPKLFGFNINFTRTPFGFDDERAHRIFDTLKPGLLRFPAGTLANFYDWRVDGWSNVPDHAPMFVKGASAQMDKVRGGRYGLDDFLALCQERDIAISFVANITTLQPEDAADWLRDLRSKGVAADFWELGNEIYDIRQAPPSVRSGTQYLEWVKPYYEALKAADDSITTALVAENGIGWNEEVAAADFAEGYVIHTYNKMSGYPFDHNLSRNYLTPERFIKKVLSEYDEEFGSEARYWNTEWNIRSVLGTSAVFASTLNALHATGYYLAVLDHQDRYEMACFHQIGGTDNVFGLIEIDQENPDTAVNLNRVFLALSLLGESFDGAESSIPLEVSGVELGETGLSGVIGRAFKKVDGQTIDFFFVNRLPVSQQVKLDQEAYQSDFRLRILSGESLSDITRAPLEEPEQLIKESMANEIVLPPYAVARITVELL